MAELSKIAVDSVTSRLPIWRIISTWVVLKTSENHDTALINVTTADKLSPRPSNTNHQWRTHLRCSSTSAGLGHLQSSAQNLESFVPKLFMQGLVDVLQQLATSCVFWHLVVEPTMLESLSMKYACSSLVRPRYLVSQRDTSKYDMFTLKASGESVRRTRQARSRCGKARSSCR